MSKKYLSFHLFLIKYIVNEFEDIMYYTNKYISLNKFFSRFSLSKYAQYFCTE